MLAAKESWCWKIVCTTCGHLYFRYAFRELVQGKHPQSADWRSGKAHHQELHDELGSVPPLGGWPIPDQRALASVLAGARLKDIASRARFPDWLGYLGLALLYSEDVEREDRSLTKAWVPQLLEILPPQARSRPHLQGILDDPASVFTWRHLEEVESDLLGAKRR